MGNNEKIIWTNLSPYPELFLSEMKKVIKISVRTVVGEIF
jgi:hypothetical protein